MMNWILLVMATIASVVIAMVLGGLLSPRTRVATRTLHCDRRAADVYRLVREADGPPRWCPTLPTMRVLEEIAPSGLAFELLDDDGAVLGTWQVTVRETAQRSAVSITECVTVSNPVVRFVRSFGGSGARVQQFLEAVARELEVPAVIDATAVTSAPA